MQEEDKNIENAAQDEILDELQFAYKSLNALKESPSHRKILLDIERKIRKEKEQAKDSEASQAKDAEKGA
ncbi:MAG: hypothetical protein R3Y46_03430 [Opitutales bacterium]